MYITERLCWDIGDVSGEGVWDTEEIRVVLGIITEFEVRCWSIGGVGAVVGVGVGVDVVVDFSMMQYLCVYVCE